MYPQGCVGSTPTVGTTPFLQSGTRIQHALFTFPRSSAVSSEVFYLLLQGEQRGPYTVKQIDHQLNSGLIGEDTTYWREGMEEWQPVTNLVALRRRKKRWKVRGSVVAAIVVLLFLGRFFGPTALEGWREMAQYEFTERAAYWKAREAVRREALPKGALVRFSSFASASAVLEPSGFGANVELHGELTGSDGKAQPMIWKVVMAYDPKFKQWTAQRVEGAGGGVVLSCSPSSTPRATVHRRLPGARPVRPHTPPCPPPPPRCSVASAQLLSAQSSEGR